MENNNVAQIGYRNHVSYLQWLREMDKFVAEQPPYNCKDDEAVKRFEGILNSLDRRQELKEVNRSRTN